MAGRFDGSRKHTVTIHCEKSAENTAFSGVSVVSSPIQERQGQGKPSSLEDLAKRRDSVDIKEDDRGLTSTLTVADFCEFQVNLVYTECFRRARAT